MRTSAVRRFRVSLAAAAMLAVGKESAAIVASANQLYINDVVGATTFYASGYTGTRARLGNIEAGYAWAGHETLSPIGSDLRLFSDPALNATSPAWIDWHATAVSQIAVGRGTANRQRGIAHGAGLYSGALATTWNTGGSAFATSFNIPVTTAGNASYFGPYYAAAVGGVTNTTTGSTINHGTVDVINSSWGNTSFTNARNFYSFAFDALTWASGKPFVVAAGNSGPGTNSIGSPASSINAFVVASLRGTSAAPFFDEVSPTSSRGPSDFFLTTSTNGSTGTNLVGVRARIDIAAPGEGLTVAAYGGKTGGNAAATGSNVFASTNTYFSNLSGTSLAAPVVAGGALLLVDVAKDRFPGSTGAVDGRTIKAVLMNSAAKTAAWNNATTVTSGVFRTTQGLDLATGAGRLDLASAFNTFTSGVTDLPGSAPGVVSSRGWDAGAVAAPTSSASDYPFDAFLLRGSTFTATVSWYARGTYSITPNYTARYGSFFDLDLQLYRSEPWGDVLVAESASLYNASEHLHFTLPASGQYFLRVVNRGAHWQFGSDAAVPFGLAWSSASIPGATLATSVWDAPGSGTWSQPANWARASVPSVPGAVAIFPAVISSPSTVTLTGSASLGRLRFDGINPYEIAGADLVFDPGSAGGDASVEASSGTHFISARIVATGRLDVSASLGGGLNLTGGVSGPGGLRVSGAGTVTLGGSLDYSGHTTIDGGTLRLLSPLITPASDLMLGSGAQVELSASSRPTAGEGEVVARVARLVVGEGALLTVPAVDRTSVVPAVLVFDSLTLHQGGHLDLGNGDALARGADLSSLRSAVSSWWNGGGRNGTGLGTSAQIQGLPAAAWTTLAVVPAASSAGFLSLSEWAGLVLDADDILIKYTYLGDTDLNGLVDARDVNRVLHGWSAGLVGWSGGDTNYDGVVDGFDYLNVLQALQNQGSPLATGPGTGSTVPEPCTAMISVPILLALTRRNRPWKRRLG